MGGHGNHPEVPKPDIYKVEDVPELVLLREKLAEKGLKDPWLRNEVWRFTALPKNRTWLAFRVLTRGMAVGFVAFLITLGVEKQFGITYGRTKEHH